MHGSQGAGHPVGVVSLQRSMPPSAAEYVQQWALDAYADVAMLRDGLRDATSRHLCPGAPGNDDWCGYLAVIATELATNALMHGDSPVTADLLLAGSSFVLVVGDGDPGGEPAIAEARPPGAGGFGLRLVQDLADDAGWHVQGSRKYVWARLIIPTDGCPGQRAQPGDASL